MAKKFAHAAGKRKSALAKATVTDGSGNVKINSISLPHYTPELARMKIMEPLILLGDKAKKINVNVNVKGGGFQSQAEASRLAIARALVDFTKDKSLRKTFLDYDRHLIVGDTRRTETSKPNDSKPRKKRQKSYR